jgi:hypothetical protein
MWPCRRNGEQGKWEPIATCRNVHQASHVRLHGLDPSAEKGIERSLHRKIPLENVVLDVKMWISKRLDVSVYTGFIWLRIGTAKRLYRTQQCIFRLYGMTGIGRVDEQLLASKEVLMPLGDGHIISKFISDEK